MRTVLFLSFLSSNQSNNLSFTWPGTIPQIVCLLNARCYMLSTNKGFIMVHRKRRVGSIQLLPVGNGGLLSFLYPIFYRTDSCFHLKAQLKHLPSLQKEEMKMKKIHQFKLFSAGTFRGKPQWRQSQKRRRGAKRSHGYQLHKAVALSAARVGKDTRHHTGVGCLIQWGKKKQATNQSRWKFQHCRQEDILASTIKNLH